MALDLTGDVVAMLRSGEFAESIAYWPAGVQANARTILAIIDRDAIVTYEGMEPIKGQSTTVTVANSATLGIASTEIDIGLDRVVLALRHGETATERGIARIMTHDSGALTFEVE